MSLSLDSDRERRKRRRQVSWWVAIIIILWVVLGISAYVMAFRCTAPQYGGGEARKIGMMFMAGLLGPFWFLLYMFEKKHGYCVRT